MNKHGNTGNKNAGKKATEKVTGKGRIVCDLGDLKTQLVRASKSAGYGGKIKPALEDSVKDYIQKQKTGETHNEALNKKAFLITRELFRMLLENRDHPDFDEERYQKLYDDFTKVTKKIPN